MTPGQYSAFTQFRDAFRAQVQEWNDAANHPVVECFSRSEKCIETPIPPIPLVYNSALDHILPAADIKLIVVGDNPGVHELEMGEYMVGMSGKLARGFFARHPELGIDWEKNVIVLNKTPVHTPRTADLRRIETTFTLANHPVAECFSHSEKCIEATLTVTQLLHDSQVWMAEHTVALHRALWDGTAPALWVVGYGELRKGGVFRPWLETLKDYYPLSNSYYPMVFQHFSMNRFAIDFDRYQEAHPALSTAEALSELGSARHADIFLWG